jgi:hypothetical protein
MAIGGKHAGRNTPFERMLDDLEEADSLHHRNASVGAAALWPGASATPSGESFCLGGAVESLYAESQFPAPKAAPVRDPKMAENTADIFEIRRELAAARSLGELKSLRRRCALTAHPDRVSPLERPRAEKLMAEVNAAIDRAIKNAKFAP